MLVLFLYLWYNHIISVSNGCMGGISPWLLDELVWYCCQSHLNLMVDMVVRCLPVFS